MAGAAGEGGETGVEILRVREFEANRLLGAAFGWAYRSVGCTGERAATLLAVQPRMAYTRRRPKRRARRVHRRLARAREPLGRNGAIRVRAAPRHAASSRAPRAVPASPSAYRRGDTIGAWLDAASRLRH